MSFSQVKVWSADLRTNWSSIFLTETISGLSSNSTTEFSDFSFQGLDNGPRLVTSRKDASVVFDLKFNTIFCKKLMISWIIKLGEDTVEKRPFPGMPASRSSRVPLLVTLQRPPPVPANFFPSFRFFDEEGFLSIKATGNRSHHTSRTSTNDDSIKMFHSSIVPQKQEMKSPLVKNAINQFHTPSANHHLLHKTAETRCWRNFNIRLWEGFTYSV